MRYKWLIFTIIAIALIIIFAILFKLHQVNEQLFSAKIQNLFEIKLPAPAYQSKTSVEEALKNRRSIRFYKNAPLTLQQIAQLLWAAQGITSDRGFRTAPSAGALYPLEIYLVSGNVNDLPAGIYHYLPEKHALQQLIKDDKRIDLSKAAFEQNAIKQAAGDIIITANFSLATKKYGERGKRFAQMEAGHAAQNIYLQTVSLNLGTVSIGAFDDALVKKVLSVSNAEVPLYILPIGKI